MAFGAVLAFLVCFQGCAGSPAAGSGSAASADAVVDAATAADADAAADAVAATVADAAAATDAAADLTTDTAAGPKTTAWGTVTGTCGTLTPTFTSKDPSFWVNTYTFTSAKFDALPLRPFAAKRFSGPNAGGSSKCSEAMSMQLLYDCEGVKGLKTEVEIVFTRAGPNTDWEGIAGTTKLGVSVSRAYQGPTDNIFTDADAVTLLKKKLGGINASSLSVAPADKWTKQILHIWTLQPTWVPILQAAWSTLDPALKADTVVVVTVEVGSTAITADTCAK